MRLLLGELLLCDGQQEALERADSVVSKLRNELTVRLALIVGQFLLLVFLSLNFFAIGT